MKAPTMGNTQDTPTQVFTFLAAVEVGSWSSSVRYIMRLLARPMNVNLSATSTTAKQSKTESITKLIYKNNMKLREYLIIKIIKE